MVSEVISRIRSLVASGNIEVTLHGFRKLSSEEILLDEVVGGVDDAIVVEDYPEAKRGPSLLVLQLDRHNNPVHLVWGIPKGEDGPAVLITVYRPDPKRWSANFTMRASL